MLEAVPASRRRGPRTPEGRARSAMNALKHGLRARRFALLPHEDPAEFEALAAAARSALRPACPIERELVEAIAVALWREQRADRLEAEVLADIAPADGSRTCGSDLLEPHHRASLAVLLRYRAQAAGAVRRTQEALARHRRLVAEARAQDDTNEFQAFAPPEPDGVARTAAAGGGGEGDARDGANEFLKPAGMEGEPPEAGQVLAFPEATTPPQRVELREAVRKAANPLDTPLLRALGRDPDLVLPVPGLIPEAWPLAQHKADPSGAPQNGQGPYRRVPHLPYGEWLAHQHLLPEMERARARRESKAA